MSVRATVAVRARALVPDSTRSTNQIRDAILSFTNPSTIPFLNKTYFKYSFVKDNYPYENIYIYIYIYIYISR